MQEEEGGQQESAVLILRLIEDYGEEAAGPRHPGQEEGLEIGVLIRERSWGCGKRRPRVFYCPARFFFFLPFLLIDCYLLHAERDTGQGNKRTERESEHPNPSHLIKPRSRRQRTDPRE